MHLLLNLFVDAAGWLLILSCILGLLLRWENSVLVARIEAVKQHVQGMKEAEIEAYLCKPEINRLFRLYEIRHKIPEDQRYSKLILVRRAINQAFAQVD